MEVRATGIVPLLENTPDGCDVYVQGLRSSWHERANKVKLMSVQSEERGIKEEAMIMKMLEHCITSGELLHRPNGTHSPCFCLCK